MGVQTSRTKSKEASRRPFESRQRLTTLLRGDFHPANRLRTTARCVVIDWTNATGGYLRSYARELPLDRALVRRWLPVWAAARLSEGIDAERESLLRRAG